MSGTASVEPTDPRQAVHTPCPARRSQALCALRRDAQGWAADLLRRDLDKFPFVKSVLMGAFAPDPFKSP